MVKNYRCPGCGATFEYDPQDGMMHCPYCRSTYDPEEIGKREAKRAARRGGRQKPPATRSEVERERRKATIRMNIAICNSCGAELAVNDVEVSSFCPYCGNAAVVMDRVEDRLAPDAVIPFKITQEEAESIIRKRLRSGFFVSKDFKNFEVERLRGIYIPFWLYDIYYGVDQKRSYDVTKHKYFTETKYEHVVADCVYHQMTIDASKEFNDSSSRRLEPYYMEDLEPFNAAYLSGLYSDRFDVGSSEADNIALTRAQDLFDLSLAGEIQHPEAEVDKQTPVSKVLRSRYALLPVWFLTFRHKDRPYTLLVNGQTGKMVGAAPVSRTKTAVAFLLLATILGLALGYLGGRIMEAILPGMKGATRDDRKGTIFFCALWVAGTVYLWYWAIQNFISVRWSIHLSRSQRHNKLAKERQDRS